jgi:hypothetical protein
MHDPVFLGVFAARLEGYGRVLPVLVAQLETEEAIDRYARE